MMFRLRCGGTQGATTRQWGGYGGSKRVRISLVIALLARPDLATRISSSFTRGGQIVSSPLFASLLLISTLSRSLAPTPHFRTPKSTETVESVQNAFNEISSTRAYFVQRHSRIVKKPCTAVNTAILKQHYQNLI